MAKRTENWNPDISKKLQKKTYRQQFFLTLIEKENLKLREAIYVFARTMGTQEFAKLIGLPASKLKNDIKWSTLALILRKIGVKLSAKVA